MTVNKRWHELNKYDKLEFLFLPIGFACSVIAATLGNIFLPDVDGATHLDPFIKSIYGISIGLLVIMAVMFIMYVVSWIKDLINLIKAERIKND